MSAVIFPLPGGAVIFSGGFNHHQSGRKLSMLFGGILFFASAVVNAAAKDVAMLIIGRILLGSSIGFANQVNGFMELLANRSSTSQNLSAPPSIPARSIQNPVQNQLSRSRG